MVWIFFVVMVEECRASLSPLLFTVVCMVGAFEPQGIELFFSNVE